MGGRKKKEESFWPGGVTPIPEALHKTIDLLLGAEKGIKNG